MQGDRLWQILSREPEIERPDEVDIEKLWSQYFQRQHLLGDIIRGEIHPDDLLDCLLEHEMSPDDYLAEVDDDLQECVG
jgi:hypothetical protein